MERGEEFKADGERIKRNVRVKRETGGGKRFRKSRGEDRKPL